MSAPCRNGTSGRQLSHLSSGPGEGWKTAPAAQIGPLLITRNLADSVVSSTWFSVCSSVLTYASTDEIHGRGVVWPTS